MRFTSISTPSIGAWAALLVAAIAAAPSAQAAAINYGNLGPVPPGISYLNVTESSGTDTVPLFGPPATYPGGLIFHPNSFISSSSGGSADVTDGQLNYTIVNTSTPTANAILSISLSEGGDYSLLGSGTSLTSAIAGASLHVLITEINGVAVAPIAVPVSNASVAFNLAANPGVVQPWSLGTSAIINLPAGQRATRVDVVIDDALNTISQASSIATIAKKTFQVDVTTTSFLLPEPTSIAALGLLGTLVRRRRR